MSVRLISILVISAITFTIILFSVLFGIMFVSQNITAAQETDMQVAADIADLYISAEITLLYLKAGEIAEQLKMADDERLTEVLSGLYGRYPEFAGLAVFDTDTGRISHTGLLPAPEDALKSTHIAEAYRGLKTLNSTYESGDSAVFYAAVLIPHSHNRLLAVTIPGTYFREKLLEIVIWETGYVFMVDKEGVFVSNPREHWVLDRNKVSVMAREDEGFRLLNETVDKMRRGETGVGYYSIYDVRRVCAYKPVTGSEDGWSLGAIAPLPESPFRFVNTGLLSAGLVAFLLSIAAAVTASTFINKPFERIAALKEESERNSMYKTQFLASMSHEIRTPMNTILGITQIQSQRDNIDTESREALAKIQNSGELLLNIIGNILDLIKSETGKYEPAEIDFDVAELVSGTNVSMQIKREQMPYGSILIVDDIEANIYVARGLMLPYRLTIDTAGSGPEAIEKIKSGRIYDIIFMDHMMPEMDGIETVRRIREAGYKHPIIALTAYAVIGQNDIFMQNGFDDFIPKPIDIRRLDGILNKWIRDKHPGENTGIPEFAAEVREETTRFSDISIPGINVAEGYEKFGRNEDIYIKVLSSFTGSARRLLKVIRAAGDIEIEEYKMAVHSIKGMCFDLLADELGETAKKLETAANAGDLKYIEDNNEKLVKILAALIDDIESVILSFEAENPKQARNYPDTNALLKLLNACRSYSIDEIDSAMKEINMFRYEADDGLADWLREMAGLSEFDEISEKLSQLCEDGADS